MYQFPHIDEMCLQKLECVNLMYCIPHNHHQLTIVLGWTQAYPKRSSLSLPTTLGRGPRARGRPTLWLAIRGLR